MSERKKNGIDEQRRKRTLSETENPVCKRKDIENEDEGRQGQQRRTTKIFQFSNTDIAHSDNGSAFRISVGGISVKKKISFYLVFVRCHNGASFPFLALSCLSFFRFLCASLILFHLLPSIPSSNSVVFLFCFSLNAPTLSF